MKMALYLGRNPDGSKPAGKTGGAEQFDLAGPVAWAIIIGRNIEDPTTDMWRVEGWKDAGIDVAPLYLRSSDQSVPGLKIGDGVTIKNFGWLPDDSDRKPYFVFDNEMRLSEVNLEDVSLVSRKVKYTVEQLESIGIQIKTTPASFESSQKIEESMP